MKISNVRFVDPAHGTRETVIPTQGAVDKLPQLVLVSVSTLAHRAFDLLRRSNDAILVCDFLLEKSNYPPAKPGALGFEPLKAALEGRLRGPGSSF